MSTVESDLERIVARDHARAPRLLGAHPDRRRRRSCAPSGPTPTRVVVQPDGGEPVAADASHPAGVFEATRPGARAAAALRARGRATPAATTLHAARPLRVPADARRHGPAPRRRGPPRGALRDARRARARDRRRRRDVVRGLGAGRALGERRRRLQLAGTGACTRCARWARSGIWELFVPGVRRGRALQVRDPHAGRRAAAEGRPVRLRGRGAAADRVGRPPLAPRVGRRRSGWTARADARAAARADVASTRSTSARGGATRSTPTAR